MRKTNFLITHSKSAIFIGVLSISMLWGCASTKPELHASQYRFSYNDEAYRLRSISSEDKTESYNELIGTTFVAIDFDQDRLIDHIQLGEVSLNEAQKIYEYGLEMLSKENRLQWRIPEINRYVYENCDSHLEIISFRPANAQPFNEFKIVGKNQIISPQTTVFVDQNADGNLDEVLKGTVKPEEAQSHYTEAIEAGLQRGALIKINGAILVKEK